MNRRLLVIGLAALLAVSPGTSAAQKGRRSDPTPVPTAAPSVTDRPPAPFPFQPGERLEYEVSWLKIRAGTLTVQVAEQTEFDGRPGLRLAVAADTSRRFSRFFELRDRITSIVTAGELVSLFFSKDLREGRYRTQREVRYDLENEVALYKDQRIPIPPDVRDPIACLFYLRATPFVVGQEIPINANSDGRNYPITVVVHRRTEVEVPAGRFKAFELEPLPTFEGRVFEAGSSNFAIFLSDDERRLPVLLTSRLPIGTLRAELKKVEPPLARPSAPAGAPAATDDEEE